MPPTLHSCNTASKTVYSPGWYCTVSPVLDQTFHSKLAGEELSGEEQINCASAPAVTESGPVTVTPEGGSEHRLDKKLPVDSQPYLSL